MNAGQEEKDGLLAHVTQDIEEWAEAHTGSLEQSQWGALVFCTVSSG